MATMENLLRDSGSRCLGSDYSDSSPGDIPPDAGRNRKPLPAEGRPFLSLFAFLRETKAKRAARRAASPPTLISRSSDRVVTLRIHRTPSVSPRLINFTLPVVDVAAYRGPNTRLPGIFHGYSIVTRCTICSCGRVRAESKIDARLVR